MSVLTVSDCMTREIYAVLPETSLEVAARLFSSKHISGVPVVDTEGRGVGVVTLRDIADPDRARSPEHGSSVFFKLVGGTLEPHEGGRVASAGRVHDVMTSFVVSVGADMPVSEAMRLMVTDGIHRIFVHDQQKKIAGIVTSMDILRALLT
jgi:predicted transcriptional regulator